MDTEPRPRSRQIPQSDTTNREMASLGHNSDPNPIPSYCAAPCRSSRKLLAVRRRCKGFCLSKEAAASAEKYRGKQRVPRRPTCEANPKKKSRRSKWKIRAGEIDLEWKAVERDGVVEREGGKGLLQDDGRSLGRKEKRLPARTGINVFDSLIICSFITKTPGGRCQTAYHVYSKSQTTPSVLCKPNPQKRPSISNINLAGHPLTL
ncbi:hypothetical protein EJB05_08464, partial [Eragrostis curvula]